MNITRLRTEVDKLKSTRPDDLPPQYTDTEFACRAAGLIQEHRRRPSPIGQRLLDILNTAGLRAAGLI
ncbi:MAG: hypothetical protein HZB40_16705 [Rhodocyclales bacterium]|nr:hypothetical protein [Rhodocyclales bacterium]